jgi:UbiA prenyltransferase family
LFDRLEFPQVNPLTAALGVGNIVLYAACYTPLKQMHPINTWVGAIVGAIPPLMGWTAATGSIDPGGMFLAGVLYFWQLPHFMSLAWMCKEDYARGGHRMISLLDTSGRRTAAVALRNSLAMVPLGLCAVHLGVAHSPFIYESVALSLVFALSASAFYTRPSQQVRCQQSLALSAEKVLLRPRGAKAALACPFAGCAVLQLLLQSAGCPSVCLVLSIVCACRRRGCCSACPSCTCPFTSRSSRCTALQTMAP